MEEVIGTLAMDAVASSSSWKVGPPSRMGGGEGEGAMASEIDASIDGCLLLLMLLLLLTTESGCALGEAALGWLVPAATTKLPSEAAALSSSSATSALVPLLLLS